MNGGVIKENFAASVSEGALFAYPNAVVNANGGEMHGLTVIDDNSMITKSKDAKGVTSFFGELRCCRRLSSACRRLCACRNL